MNIINVTREEAVKLAKTRGVKLGSWQYEVIRYGANCRQLKGKAKKYESNYCKSLCGLRKKLNDAGIIFQMTYGPRGGNLGGLENFQAMNLTIGEVEIIL